MKRLFGILILLIFMALGVAFAIVNAEPVEFNYYYGTMTQPLSILLVGAFTIGALLAIFINFLVILGLKRKLHKAERMLHSSENTVTAFERNEK